MLRYTMSDYRCRSRMLLEYFGEKKTKDCKQCDVCLASKNGGYSNSQYADAKVQITKLLSTRKSLPLTKLMSLNIPTKLIDAVLQDMLQEEEAMLEDGTIRLNTL